MTKLSSIQSEFCFSTSLSLYIFYFIHFYSIYTKTRTRWDQKLITYPNIYTATILLGSTLTLINNVSSFMKCLFFNISCETNLGKPKPKESGSLLGLWKFFQVGSGMKLSTMLHAFSGQVDWSKSVNETEWEKGHLSKASYSPGRIFM